MEKGDLKIDVNTVVHCATNELANQVLAIADNLGYKWVTGKSYKGINCWDIWKERTCYILHTGKFGDIDRCSDEDLNKKFHRNGSYKILEAEDFLKLHENNEAEIKTPNIGL